MEDTPYLQVISRIERLHRQFLEVVKVELEDTQDINGTQALMMWSMDDTEISVGELTLRGHYLATNVSYNVKKTVENGYLSAQRSTDDLRSIRVKLTEKGRALRDRLNAMYQRHVKLLGQHDISEADLQGAAAVLERLERFWVEARNPYSPRRASIG
jgi:DNA-binding MarR family transcriptional regulator